jgi:hypothetical protein
MGEERYLLVGSALQLTSAQYQAAFDGYIIAQGYRPKHVYGYDVSGTARYTATWDKPPTPGNGALAARHGLTSSQYQQAFNSHAA